MDTVLRVPMANIIAMVTTLILAVGVPIALCVMLRVKYKASVKYFFIGCGIFILFALLLEQTMHIIVLGALGPVSQAINSNILLYALYGGLAAALFEETGRLAAMKLFMKEPMKKENALMYGAGHGGIEAILLVGLGYVSNLAASFMLNAGSMDAMLAGAGGAELYQQAAPLATLGADQFYLAGVERLLAIVLHMALSVLVYYSIGKNGRKICFVLALLFHFLIDFVAVLISRAAPLLVVEAVILLMTAGAAYVAYRFYREKSAA